MRISVNLPDDDVRFIDEQAGTRSAVLRKAVSHLRERQLSDQYAEAFGVWDSSPDAEPWDTTTADGIAP